MTIRVFAFVALLAPAAVQSAEAVSGAEDSLVPPEPIKGRSGAAEVAFPPEPIEEGRILPGRS